MRDSVICKAVGVGDRDPEAASATAAFAIHRIGGSGGENPGM